MPKRETREQSRYRAPARRLARLMRERRETMDMSQQRLAQRAGVAIGTVRAIESMRTVEPGFFTIIAMAAALDLAPQALVAEVFDVQS